MPSSISISRRSWALEFIAQCQRPRHFEQVVARNTDAQCTGCGFGERVVEHRLVVRIDIGLGRIGRGLPIVKFSFDLLP